METERFELIEVELKYCERCGGLWLRRKGCSKVYCASCEPAMAEFRQACLKPAKRGATRVSEDLEGWVGEYGVFCAEGNA